MAITTTGNISIKTAAGAANSIDSVMSATSSGSLVALSQASNEYTGSTRGSTPRDTDSAPYGMLEFSGYSHILVDDTWPTVDTPSGSSGNAIPQGAPTGWGQEFHHVYGSGNVAEAFCRMQFTLTETSAGVGNVKIETSSGTAAAMATTYTGYLNWSGLEETTSVAVKYVASTTTDSGNSYGPNNPAEDGYNSGTWYYLQDPSVNHPTSRQFWWDATRNSQGTGMTATTSVVFYINVFDTENWGDGDVHYSFQSNSDTIFLTAQHGPIF